MAPTPNSDLSPAHAAGFTLVEAMVATTITVTLVAIVFSAYVASSRAVSRGLARAANEDAAIRARQLLSRDLLSASRAVVYPTDSLRLWLGGAGQVTYKVRDSSLFRGSVPVFREAVALRSFRVLAVRARADTLRRVADTKTDALSIIRVELRIGDRESERLWSVEVTPRTDPFWPDRPEGPQWPDAR